MPLPLQIGTHLPVAALMSTSAATRHGDSQHARSLSLTYAGSASLDVPLAIQRDELGTDPVPIHTLSTAGQDAQRRRLVRARVWEWSGVALDEGGAAAAWLSDALDKPARCARFNCTAC